MTDFNDFHIDEPTAPQGPAGRYDNLVTAGTTTRFKGTSGNPKGRPKRKQPGCFAEEFRQLLCDTV
jgi:hypothetical protein